MTVKEAFATELAVRETRKDGHRWCCELGVDRKVYGETEEDCVKAAVKALCESA